MAAKIIPCENRQWWRGLAIPHVRISASNAAKKSLDTAMIRRYRGITLYMGYGVRLE